MTARVDAATVPVPSLHAPRGITLLGVVPFEAGDETAWEAADPKLGVRLVPSGDLAALVAHAPPEGADGDPLHVTARHWEVHRALLRGDVVPAPPGVVFREDDEVVAFLTQSYATLRGALARVAGRWEFRLHVSVVDPAFPEPRALDLATHIYAELRRAGGSAVTLISPPGRILSAAFLVERAASADFRAQVDRLARLNSALDLDLTGPWPAYDFVQMHG